MPLLFKFYRILGIKINLALTYKKMDKSIVYIRRAVTLIGLFLSIVSCVGNNRDLTDIERPEHLIVIGVDAMSPNGIVNAATPVLDHIMKNGAFTLNARGVLPTSSSTNWASMVSGAGPEQHGVTSNGWERDDFNFPPVTTGMENIFPTIFGEARIQLPELEIGAIYTWNGFGRLIERSALSFDANGSNDEDTMEMTINYIKEKKPGFLFVHFDNVDHTGHEFGHKTQKYYDAVSHADYQIGKIIQATKDVGIFEGTTFIISADHGGIGYGHGGETLDELEIPFMLFGKGVKKDYNLKNKIYTYDNAATMAYLLGLEQPYAWIGKPVKEAFIGIPEPDLGNQKIAIATPIIYPKPILYDAAGGLYVDELPEVKMEGIIKAQIRYTTDGSIPTKSSQVYTAPFQLDKSTVITAKTFLGENGESNAATAYYRVVKKDSKNGVQYSYYEGIDWQFLPIFEKLQPIKTGTKFEFRIDNINRRNEQFGIQFKAFLKIENSGQYRFYLNSDDGSNLYIDGRKVVDNDGGHGTLERMGSLELEKGMHKITVDYHNQAGGAWLDVFYKGPGVPKQIIPVDKLFLDQ